MSGAMHNDDDDMNESLNIRPSRRSGRARTPIDRFQPSFRRKQTPKSTKNNRSRSRDPEYYAADEVPQAPKFSQLKNNVQANAFAAGVIRIPLISEVMKISINIIDMRQKEIFLIKDAIKAMKENDIDEDLITEIQKGCDVLEWEMDETNVVESDLPPLGPETTNYTDISTWVIFYYDLLHENYHRIIDLIHLFTKVLLPKMPKKEKQRLAEYEASAENVMDEFKKNVQSLRLIGESKSAYIECVKEIKKNCELCTKH